MGYRKIQARGFASDIIILSILILASAITVTPLMRMFLASFITAPELAVNLPTLIKTLGLDNYREVFNILNILNYATNSVIYTATGVASMALLGAMAAFSLVKYPIKYKKVFYLLLLMGQLTPIVVVLIPIFQYLKLLNLINTRMGIILVYIARGLPFSIFLLTGFFRDFPDDLLDSARIEGCSEPRMFFSIVLPVSRSGLSVVIIFQAIWLWNEFLIALVLLFTDQLKSLSIGIYSAIGQYTTNYPLLFAGLSLASVPVIVLFAVFQKQFVAGLTGSVKG